MYVKQLPWRRQRKDADLSSWKQDDRPKGKEPLGKHCTLVDQVISHKIQVINSTTCIDTQTSMSLKTDIVKTVTHLKKCSTPLAVREINHTTYNRTTKIKVNHHNKCWWEYRATGTLIYCRWEYKIVQLLQTTVWQFFIILNIRLPYDPEFPLLDIYKRSEILCPYKNLYANSYSNSITTTDN